MVAGGGRNRTGGTSGARPAFGEDSRPEERHVESWAGLLASLTAGTALAETLSPEADACKASGLIALKQKYPQVKDVLIDLDSAKIIKTDTTIEDVPIRTIVIGDAYVERTKTTKPQTLVCVIGTRGKVLLTLFSDK